VSQKGMMKVTMETSPAICCRSFATRPNPRTPKAYTLQSVCQELFESHLEHLRLAGALPEAADAKRAAVGDGSLLPDGASGATRASSDGGRREDRRPASPGSGTGRLPEERALTQ
jgi:hypothetical protein